MVTVLGPKDLAEFQSRGDPILVSLGEGEGTSHRWLAESAPKRLVYDRLYGDLLREQEGLSILDVGGGYTRLTQELARRHNYVLLEIFAHDDPARMAALVAESGGRIAGGDWYTWEPDAAFDVIIANDLFPNVDQRLGLFLERYLPYCKELRLSLTYYNRLRFYETRRVDADEILFVLAWNGEQVWRTLEPFAELPADSTDQVAADESIFPNGRQVAVATLRGGRLLQ